MYSGGALKIAFSLLAIECEELDPTRAIISQFCASVLVTSDSSYGACRMILRM